MAGWLPLSGTEDHVGALLLAVADAGRLVYAGRVGTGFDTRTRADLARRLAGLSIDAPAIEGAPRTKRAHWVTPALVCECAFSEWTSDGSMRHPRFLGLREDKTPLECVRDREEEADEDRAVSPAASPASSASPTSTEPSVQVATRPARGTTVGGPKLTNPDKVLFPRDGITKRDIWNYYEAVAPVILPHLAGRPLTLQRYPDGIDGEEWYQQNAPPKTPPFVRLVDVGPRHDNKYRIACDDLDTLRWLANLAALTLHRWCVQVPPSATTRAAIDQAIAQPDHLILDLDPGSGPWAHLVEVARAVRALLGALKLQSFVKTSGKRGVHVIVPFAPGPTHERATGFAEQVARAVAKVLPEIATVERMKEKRGGRLYVDYGQNGEGRTVVAPYVIRARDGAVVSTPIEWDELDEELDPTRFTVRSVPLRIAERGDLFAGSLMREQRLPAV